MKSENNIMINAVAALINWVISVLNGISDWLESKGRLGNMKSKFVDLAPTDEADKAGVYSDAILFATSNPRISNIALTGPYGSGKSSIIKTFLKKYRRPALLISLASFVPETDSKSDKASRQEIERSILQQLLYGADADSLPLSRFKRIQSPGFGAIFKSLYIMVGVVTFWYVFNQHEEIIGGDYFNSLALSNVLKLGVLGFLIIFLWTTIHHFYVASFGLSLKSISLKDVEIKPAYDDQGSILNRHLDEIIYFFQSTDYDLVVIEDLDRFNDPEIFVTLREINSLINENSGVKRSIRFLYALRDDIFINIDRTKFFEFIIPVVPIVNSSNSIDMVLKQGERLDIDSRLDRQFLREVSRYLDDLRLIRNIFNEYAVYAGNLETDGENILDANKLLAVLIYKNFYPRDFEKLHRGAGVLAEILNFRDELIGQGEAKYRAEIAEIERQLEVAERQTPSNIRELRQIYAMAFIEMVPENNDSLTLDGNIIPFSGLVEHEGFERLLEAREVVVCNARNQRQRVDVTGLQSKVSSNKSYQERKDEIKLKASEDRTRNTRRISELRSLIAKLRTTKLNELLRLDVLRVQELFDKVGENGELARFLILEGYLDDTYYQYTSLFHSGRLSPSDNKFLIQIRAFKTPEPSYHVDNPKEIIAAMRDEDFRQSYVLNIKIVDSILADQGAYREQARKLFECISSDFDGCEKFLEDYYASGEEIPALLSGLVGSWKGFIPAIIASSNNAVHVTQVIANLSEKVLKDLSGKFHELPSFVSDNLSQILENVPELKPSALVCLGFEVKSFSAIEGHVEVVQAMFERELFELNASNLEYVYKVILGKPDISLMREKNFTTIRSLNNEALISRVKRDFNSYLNDVLLELPDNSKEDAAAVSDLIGQEGLGEDSIRAFLERQEVLLPSLEGIPEGLHAMIFELAKIEPTWGNCISFMEGKSFEPKRLVDYLERDFVRATILEKSIPGESDALELRRFMVEARELSDGAYREYVHALPRDFKKFPEEIESTKLQILIEEGKVVFNQENVDSLVDNRELQVLFVEKNISLYLEEPDAFSLDDSFREDLLRSRVDDVAKLSIINQMNLEGLDDLSKRSALIGTILVNSDADISKLGGDVAKSLIKHSSPVKIKIRLLNKSHMLLTNDEVRQLLTSLPKPYCDISTGFKTPKLKRTPENMTMVKWLDSRNIISSWREGGLLSDDIRVNLYRK